MIAIDEKNNLLPEVLAPAGDLQSLKAAVSAGADAVYFGLSDFNARRNAGNISLEDLPFVTDYCRKRKVKTYITLNTLIKDSEFESFKKYLDKIAIGAPDALIMADLGAAYYCKKTYPDLPIHASTQMSVGTLDGLQLLKSLGFERAVLPRELSKENIKHLCEKSPIELEVFVHGALCMSVSGQCLMSSVFGTRSGNRGLCAQACRLPFHSENGGERDLSLKDLSLIEHINELKKLGISSFKIEGRMKRPEYVYAAVKTVKKALCGEKNTQEFEDLKSLFSRSGFTAGYFEKKIDRYMFGYRTKEDVIKASPEILKTYSVFEDKPLYNINFKFKSKINEKAVLSAEFKNIKIRLESDHIIQKAENKPTKKEIVIKQLGKTGGTLFYADNINVNIDDGVFISVSTLNEMRRKAVALLTEKIIKSPKYEKKHYTQKTASNRFEYNKNILLFENFKQIPKIVKNKAYKIFLPLDTDEKVLNEFEAGVIIPRGIFGTEIKIKEELDAKRSNSVVCETLDAVAIARNLKIPVIIGSPFLNALNAYSVYQLNELGVMPSISFEMKADDINKASEFSSVGAEIYGRIPLMLTKNCPLRNGRLCGECNGYGEIIDRKNIKFPVRCKNGYSEIFNSVPMILSDRLKEFKSINFKLYRFTFEKMNEVETILKIYNKEEKPNVDFTRGLYFRNVL